MDRFFIIRLFLSLLILAWSTGAQEPPPAAPIPEDLLTDEHLREEFGVNDFTAPSIEKIFRDLEKLGDLPYRKLSRKLPADAPKQRSLAAISLGTLIADGLLTVQSQQRGDLQPIGRALVAHAEALGTDKRMSRHTKSLVELSLSGEWAKLKKELAATQADVEAELVQLRDANLANLISLGGWLRAFQIACQSVEEAYTPERAKLIMRVDVADYFVSEVRTLEVDALSKPWVEALRADLATLRKKMEPQGENYSKAQVTELNKEVSKILGRVLKAPAAK